MLRVLNKRYGYLLGVTLTLALKLGISTCAAIPLQLTPTVEAPLTLAALKPKIEAAVWQAIAEEDTAAVNTQSTLLNKNIVRVVWKIPATRLLPQGVTAQQAVCTSSTPKLSVTGMGFVQCKFSGKNQTVVGIPVGLEERLKVGVITQPVEPKMPLAGNFMVQERWVPLFEKNKLAPVATLLEQNPQWASITVTKQLLPVGTLLLQQQLQQPPAVQALEAVTVHLIVQSLNAPVHLVVAGTALETGRIGQGILVKCRPQGGSNNGGNSGYTFSSGGKTGDKIYRGIITEKSTVVVRL
jgi:hypothetical protein